MSKNKIKICFIVTVEFAVKAFLLNHLRALSTIYDVTVITNTVNGNFLSDYGIDVRVIPLNISRSVSFFSDIYCFIQLLKIFNQHYFKVVHTVTPKAGLLGMAAAWIMRVPLRVHTFTGQVWVTKVGFKRWFLKKIDTLIAYTATNSLIDSPSQAHFLISEDVVLAHKVIVLGQGSISGVDICRFKPNVEIRSSIRQKLNVVNDAIVYLFLGRLTIDKGVLDLAQSFANICTKYPNIHLLFVGPDEQEIQNRLIEILKENINQVSFVDYTDRPEDYMAASDVLCLPSYREGFGSVVIEAAAVGIPAMASKIYGLTDAILDGITGLLHPPKDIDAIKCQLELMVNKPMLRQQLGTQAQLRAKNVFSSQYITDAWVKFYRDNCEKKNI